MSERRARGRVEKESAQQRGRQSKCLEGCSGLGRWVTAKSLAVLECKARRRGHKRDRGSRQDQTVEGLVGHGNSLALTWRR